MVSWRGLSENSERRVFKGRVVAASRIRHEEQKFYAEHNMWRCKNCSEQVEETFNACWNCGFSRDGRNVNYDPESSPIPRVLPDGTVLSDDASREATESLDGKRINRNRGRRIYRRDKSESSQRIPESDKDGEATPKQTGQSSIKNSKLIACSACGNLISKKADFCPACGHKPRNRSSGCVVGLFRFVFGIVGAVLGLLVATHFLFGTAKTTQRDYASEIETKCREQADAFPLPTGRQDYFDNCVSGANSVLRSKGLIK